MAGLILALGILAPAAPAPSLEFHYNVTNIGGRVPSPWVVLLGQDTADVAACGSLCLQYQNGTGPLSRCRTFTRFAVATPPDRVLAGYCYGHLDPVWLPLSGRNATTTLADSGLVHRACENDFDCSYNGRCSAAGGCQCSQGWVGRRCQTLDLLPVDRAKYGFSPQDERGQNLSSWGGSILSHNGTWHMWYVPLAPCNPPLVCVASHMMPPRAARMVNYCGIGQWEQNSMVTRHQLSSPVTHVTAQLPRRSYTRQQLTR